MKFSEIHAELIRSSQDGIIHQVTKSFFDKQDLLIECNRSLVELWVHTEHIHGFNEELGRWGGRYDEIKKVINHYCEGYINLYYSGKIKHKYSPLAYLSEFETSEYYDSEDECEASGLIYQALKNFIYVDTAINSVLSHYGPELDHSLAQVYQSTQS